jgi:hypothetical protein
MQELINGFVKKGIVIAADRLYLKANRGGLGLIKIENYISALQCSWIKRCSINLNDTWRWNLGLACNFRFSNIRPEMVNKDDTPIAANIVQSFARFQDKFWKINENFLQAPLVDNRMFLRAPPERRAPVRGLVDRNLLGPAFYDRHKETLLNLKMSCLIVNNVVVDFPTLNANSGLTFTQAAYFNLVTAGNFAITKYANKINSNGTAQSVDWFLTQVKKGSKKFRKILDTNVANIDVADLRVVNTFYQLVASDKPASNICGYQLGCWNWSFLSNRIRTFCFQFFNNSLGINTRIAARYRNGGAIINNSCTFCMKANCVNPAREDFAHVFYDCRYINNTCRRLSEIYFPANANPALDKVTYMTGMVTGANNLEGFFYLLTSVLINFTMWQSRMKKIIPSVASVVEDVDNLFDSCVIVSNKILNSVTDATPPICRRWTARHHGRG